MSRTHLRILAATLLFTIPVGCTTDEIAWWTDHSHELTIARPTPPTDCFDAVNRYWPGNKAWAHKIVRRESGGDPHSKNRTSTASGCFQLLRVHSARFARLGFSWQADRFDARANVLVAWDLYREQGARPWRLTAY
jgi:hypothetical protein